MSLMTKQEMIELQQLIVKNLFSMNREEFDNWIYTHMKVSSSHNPDGLFYNGEEMLQFQRFVYNDESFGQ